MTDEDRLSEIDAYAVLEGITMTEHERLRAVSLVRVFGPDLTPQTAVRWVAKTREYVYTLPLDVELNCPPEKRAEYDEIVSRITHHLPRTGPRE